MIVTQGLSEGVLECASMFEEGERGDSRMPVGGLAKQVMGLGEEWEMSQVGLVVMVRRD